MTAAATVDDRGLVYLNNRYHDPTLGAFISVDPLVQTTGEPYTYASGNPTTYSDPLGLCWGPDFVCDAAQAIAGSLWGLSQGAWDATYGTFEDGYDLVTYVATHNPKETAGKGGEILQGLYHVAEGCNFDQDCIVDQTYVQPFLASAEENGWDYAIGELVPEAIAAWASAGASTASRTGRVVKTLDQVGDAIPDCPGNSFLAGTPVLMADGATTPIEDVVVGDWVWAADPVTGEAGPRRVIDVIVGDGSKQLVDVRIDGATVTATAQHPFWVDDAGRWVDADELAAGDELVDTDGDVVEVDAVREWSATRRVHNLTVDGIHTYFVIAGNYSALAHNCTRDFIGPLVPRERSSKLRAMWEEANGATWPTSPDGRNFDVEHIVPLADGGSNLIRNTRPMERGAHVAHHTANGDFRAGRIGGNDGDASRSHTTDSCMRLHRRGCGANRARPTVRRAGAELLECVQVVQISH